MTGFAAVSGAADGFSWNWEIRGVNARGLDLRLRLPDRAHPLDGRLRQRISKDIKRGAVQIGLRLKTENPVSAERIDPEVLADSARTLKSVRDALVSAGLEVAPIDPVKVLALPQLDQADDSKVLPFEAILRDFDTAVADFVAMRDAEGAAMSEVVAGQVDRLEALVSTARNQVAGRNQAAADRYCQQVADLVAAAGQALDADRLSHDLAALTVKGDVSEEIDRLDSHVSAARALLTGNEPVGRKLDFLLQEFNREANTLCSKSSDTALTQTGLDLKVAIDQMREQIQNLE